MKKKFPNILWDHRKVIEYNNKVIESVHNFLFKILSIFNIQSTKMKVKSAEFTKRPHENLWSI